MDNYQRNLALEQIAHAKSFLEQDASPVTERALMYIESAQSILSDSIRLPEISEALRFREIFTLKAADRYGDLPWLHTDRFSNFFDCLCVFCSKNHQRDVRKVELRAVAYHSGLITKCSNSVSANGIGPILEFLRREQVIQRIAHEKYRFQPPFITIATELWSKNLIE